MYPKHKDSKSGPVASPSFPDVEKEVLEHWEKDGTFRNQSTSELLRTPKNLCFMTVLRLPTGCRITVTY